MIRSVTGALRQRQILVLFALGTLLSALLGVAVQRDNQLVVQSALDSFADEKMQAVRDRIELYQYGLRGARGAIVTGMQSGLSRQQFVSYSETRDVDIEFPGARGFGFIRRVPADQLSVFVAAARADGWPDFSVRELTPHDGDRFVIQYIEPVYRNIQAVGLDIASETNRRNAAIAATKTGRVQLTGPITLVQATGAHLQSFLILMPIYNSTSLPPSVTERESQLFGWSYAPLLMDEVLADLDLEPALINIDLLDVDANGEATQFFHSGDNPELTPFRATGNYPMYGRKWQYAVAATPAFVSELRLINPVSVTALGTAISLLVALLVSIARENRLGRQLVVAEQAKLARLVEASGDAIISVDLDDKVVSWNRAAQEMFGYSRADALGMPITRLEVHAPEIRNQGSLGKTQVETVWRNKHRKIVDVGLTTAPIVGPNNELQGYTLTVRDISLQKEMTASILQAKERLEQQVSRRTAQLRQTNQLLDGVMRSSMNVAIIATDERGVITLFNSGAENLLEYSEDEIVSLASLTDLIADRALESDKTGNDPGDAAAQIKRLIVSQSAHRTVKDFEAVLLSQSKRKIPVKLALNEIRDDDHRVSGYVAIAIDITDEQTAQRQLERTLNQLSLAAEAAELGVWTLNLVDNSVIWNDKMFELYEWPISLRYSGVTYEHWHQRVHVDDVERVVAQLNAAIEGRDQFNPRFRVQLPSGIVRTIDGRGTVERDDNGIAVSITGFNTDVTQEVELNQRLQRAKELADEASAAKSSFLANMSHEIKTPMHSVLSMLQLLGESALNQRQDSFVKRAIVSANTLLILLNDVLDYSRIEADKLQLAADPFSLEELLRELLDIMSGNIRHKHIAFILDVPDGTAHRVVGDMLRLKQVLINLVGNAVKFTEQGHVMLRMKVVSETRDALSLRFEIIDTGIGIAHDQRETIFKSFEQASANTARRYGGTGLGLAISGRLLKLMDSQIELESELGKGSNFHFDLCLPRFEAASQPAQKRLDGVRVLLADDNAVSRASLEAQLRTLGCEVAVSASLFALQSFIKKADEKNWDVVIADSRVLTLTEEEGVERFASQLPATLRFFQLVDLSQSPVNEWDFEAQRGIVTRPSTPGQLYELLSQCLGRSADSEAASDQNSFRIANQLAGIRILVVDDVDMNREVSREILGVAGAIVTLAESGRQALQILETQSPLPDLILMDVHMPDLDGIETTRQIRQSDKFHGIPVVAMTASDSPEEIDQCLAAGMNDHIGKSLEFSKLVSAIKVNLNRQRRISL